MPRAGMPAVEQCREQLPTRAGMPAVEQCREQLPSLAPALRSGVFDRLELPFVVGVQVCLFARDQSVVVELLQRAIHRAHAFAAARLHDVLELLELALANEVGGSRRVDEYLERDAAARAVLFLAELLRNDAAQ